MILPKWCNGCGVSPTDSLPRSLQTLFSHQSGARGESLVSHRLQSLGCSSWSSSGPCQQGTEATCDAALHSPRSESLLFPRSPNTSGPGAMRSQRARAPRGHAGPSGASTPRTCGPSPLPRAPAASRRARASPAVAALRSFQSEVHARGPREGQQHLGDVKLRGRGGAHCLQQQQRPERRLH